jgi:threonine synthase
VAVTKKLIEQGKLPRDESIVICITGNGLKTLEAVMDNVEKPCVIDANIESFNAFMEKR